MYVYAFVQYPIFCENSDQKASYFFELERSKKKAQRTKKFRKIFKRPHNRVENQLIEICVVTLSGELASKYEYQSGALG